MELSMALNLGGLVVGVIGGLAAAWTTWRKDQREQKREPITQWDALLTQAGSSLSRMNDRMLRNDNRSDKVEERLEGLEVQLAAEQASRHLLEEEVELMKLAVRRWTEFGEWLHLQWSVVRLNPAPPPLPVGLTSYSPERPEH